MGAGELTQDPRIQKIQSHHYKIYTLKGTEPFARVLKLFFSRLADWTRLAGITIKGTLITMEHKMFILHNFSALPYILSQYMWVLPLCEIIVCSVIVDIKVRFRYDFTYRY